MMNQRIDIAKELVLSGLIAEKDYLKIIFMKHTIGDKVISIIDLPKIVGAGTIIGIDRTRQQYHVDFKVATYWLYEHEIASHQEVPESLKCNHKMVLYTGLTEQFNYCILCGNKEGEFDVAD